MGGRYILGKKSHVVLKKDREVNIFREKIKIYI
jgi:hypothetical protein